jgi:GT2 family glycosyltransferase
MIEIISATRLAESDFLARSALGASLKRLLPHPRMAHLIPLERRFAAYIAFENRRSLSEIYNERIQSGAEDAILLFIHDDVWIEDMFLADRLTDGLKAFDVIGLAGNRRRVPKQPAWIFKDEELTPEDHANLSGSVAHGATPLGAVTYFGPPAAQCQLLDGVFIAARRSVLRANDVLFDPRFDFHFYDMDFCRTAVNRGLRLGTWPISVTHQSVGTYRSNAWHENRERYLQKWSD